MQRQFLVNLVQHQPTDPIEVQVFEMEGTTKPMIASDSRTTVAGATDAVEVALRAALNVRDVMANRTDRKGRNAVSAPTFKPVEVPYWRQWMSQRRTVAWKARNDSGAQCLHQHTTQATAQRCCDRLNNPKPTVYSDGSPGFDHAAGYHE